MERSEMNIEELGLTKQRQVVLTVILDSPEHLTANEVFELSKQMLPKISFATVYNSLRFLKEAGHIAEINFGNGASRFDRITQRHDHAICSSCGKLVDIHLEIPKALAKKAADLSRFRPESLEVTLRGLCPECNSTQ
jgi:Fur family peroxide stress response transcriptional regulator